MENAKDAAKGFIDLMDFTKHRVGIVDYSTTTSTFDLTTDKAQAKDYIGRLKANGNTATGDAIDKARELLASSRLDAQPVIVLLTDGEATVGGQIDGVNYNAYDYALKKAEEAKNQGIVFYTIALLNANDDPNQSAPNVLLKNMATTAHHHHFVLGSHGLAEIYARIVQEIGLASAYDITITDVISKEFEIVPGSYEQNIPKPVVNGNTLVWNFLELKNDTLTFKYKIKHKTDGKVGKLPASTNSIIDYKDYSGALKSYVIPAPNISVSYPAPLITSLSPEKGLVSGKEEVTILGENFRENALVSFGNKYATNVTFVSPNELKVMNPSGTQGSASVKVVNDDGQYATASFQYYADPSITSIEPVKGPLSGGTTVLMYGEYFMKGAKVKFGDIEAPVTTVNNSGYIFTETPAGINPGPVDVTIENPDGTSAILSNGFTYNEPPKMELLSLSPNSGKTTGGENVTLTGNLFSKGATVYFGDVQVSDMTYVSGTTLIVKSPAWASEDIVDVKVVNPDGSESVLDQAYSYILPPPPPAPKIDLISPNSGPQKGGTLVYIDGANFVQGVKVILGESQEVNAEFLSSKRLRFVTPSWSDPTFVKITVINPDNQMAEVDQAFTYLAPPPKPDPKVKSVTPGNGPLKGGTLIYIDGTGFESGAKVYFVANGTETEISPVEFINSTRLRLLTPRWDQAGPVDVKVVNSDSKSSTLDGGFSYDAPPVYPEPIITSVAPNTGNKRGGNTVEIIGQNFRKGATVTFGSIDTAATFIDSTRLSVIAPASDSAVSVNVTVTNTDSKFDTLFNAYSYVEAKPEISSVSPGNGPLSGGTLVYVDGKYFERDLVFTFNGQPLNYEFVSSTRLRFITPMGQTAGVVTLTITNPSGNSATGTFTYDAPPVAQPPVITTITPGSGPIKGGTLIYIDGNNFRKNPKVLFNGVLYDVEYINSKRLRMITPKVSATGQVEVKVINSDNMESNVMTFEYK